MMVSPSGVYITMLTGRRDNPDCCIAARHEYAVRAAIQLPGLDALISSLNAWMPVRF